MSSGRSVGSPPFPTMYPWNECPYGVDGLFGEEVILDFEKIDHVLMTGDPGVGKSVLVRNFIAHAIQHPQWELSLIEGKNQHWNSEFYPFQDANNVTIVQRDSIVNTLKELVELIEYRLTIEALSKKTVREMDVPSDDYFPRHLLVVDDPIWVQEFTAGQVGAARITALLEQILTMKYAGVHVILITQHISEGEWLSGVVESFDTRFSFRTNRISEVHDLRYVKEYLRYDHLEHGEAFLHTPSLNQRIRSYHLRSRNIPRAVQISNTFNAQIDTNKEVID